MWSSIITEIVCNEIISVPRIKVLLNVPGANKKSTRAENIIKKKPHLEILKATANGLIMDI